MNLAIQALRDSIEKYRKERDDHRKYCKDHKLDIDEEWMINLRDAMEECWNAIGILQEHDE